MRYHTPLFVLLSLFVITLFIPTLTLPAYAIEEARLVASIPLKLSSGIAVNSSNHQVYVPGDASGPRRIYRIDGNSYSVTTHNVDRLAYDLQVNPKSGVVYTRGDITTPDGISARSGNTLRSLHRIDNVKSPYSSENAMSIDSQRGVVYAATYDESRVGWARINESNYEVNIGHWFGLPHIISALVINPKTQHLYVATTYPDKLYVFNDSLVIAEEDLGAWNGYRSLAVNSEDGLIYALSNNSSIGRIVVYDDNTQRIHRQFDNLPDYSHIAFNSGNGHLYAIERPNKLHILDGLTLDNISTLTIGSTILGLRDIAVDESSNKIWLIEAGAQQVHVVQDTSSPYISISHIEITQAIQDEINNVPLVAGKPTFVRVYVNCSGNCNSVSDLTGILRVYNVFGEIPSSPLSPSGLRNVVPSREDWRKQRNDLRRTLNFTLPPRLANTIGPFTLTAEVAGVTATIKDVLLQQAPAISVIYVPIRYKGREPESSRISRNSEWALRIYPTAKMIYTPGTTLEWDACLRVSLPACPPLLTEINKERLLNQLTTQYRFANAYVFGWLPDRSFGAVGGGTSDPAWQGGAGISAFGDDHPVEGSLIFAHELAHLLGRRHTKSPDSCMPESARDPNSDWPYTTARIQDYGLDGYGFGYLISSSSAVKKPENTYDYMSYCGFITYDNVWTSAWTYKQIFSRLLSSGGDNMFYQRSASLQPYIVVSGIIHNDNTAVLEPSWIITSNTVPVNPSLGTAYCIETRASNNDVLSNRCFDVEFIDYETGQATSVKMFNLALPYPNGTSRIVLVRNNQILDSQSVSANSPGIVITSPKAGEIWSSAGIYTITWNASDIDDDSLTYAVQYSSDGGTWTPVGAITTNTQITVNAAELPGGSNSRIRVLASDGINTSVAETLEPFTVGRKAPQPYISAPQDGGNYPAQTQLLLVGHAYDLEDGEVPESLLNWRSDKDGDLGIGSQVLANLSQGQHLISIIATDSDGNAVAETATIFIGYKSYLPVAQRN